MGQSNRTRLPFTLPSWLSLVLGMVTFVGGLLLSVRPFQSLTVLLWLTIGGMLLVGLSRFTSDRDDRLPWTRWIVGAFWLGAALLAAFWPGMTIRTLAWLAGVALGGSGLIKLMGVLDGSRNQRVLRGIAGLAQLIFGLLAFSIPTVTLLLLGPIFGVYVATIGLRLLWAALIPQRTRNAADRVSNSEANWWPYWLRLTGAAVGLAAALGMIVLVVSVRRAQPAAPGPFYTPPTPLPAGAPGTILRTEPVADFYPGAIAQRVLYLSTDLAGQPQAVSGLVITPAEAPPAEGRPVVAWTHGTVGVMPKCAPSLIDGAIYAGALPGLGQLIKAGYVVVAPDYQGLGTAGVHPYLVGKVSGANSLDNIRAAINLPETGATNKFVVWGESQGGQAALFTGQMAADYAPELQLLGVIASAPASDLLSLFLTKTEEASPIGNILLSMGISAWSDVYGIKMSDVVYPAAIPLVRSIANSCIQVPEQTQSAIPAAIMLNMLFISNPPWEKPPWDQILIDNTPGAVVTAAPVLIIQGDADKVIDPAVQARFVDHLCAIGTPTEYRTYAGIGHLAISHEAADEMVAWINERFGGASAATTCKST